jgi:hypothetical protein
MGESSDGVGGISPKKTGDVQQTGDQGGTGVNPTAGINWAKASMEDLRIAFILSEGPEKGQKMFNQFQMMIFQTCISQMKALEPKKHDIREDYH